MAGSINVKNIQSKPRLNMYDRLNRWFQENEWKWVTVVLCIGCIAGLLSFDIKPSIDGDDTAYVLQAMKIVSSGQIPFGFRTPGYPIVLSFFIWLFGVNIVLLKMISFVFYLATIVSLFAIFRYRIQPIILSSLLLFVAINPQVLKYSHQTFSEILFLLLFVGSMYCTISSIEQNSWKMTVLAAVMTMLSFYVRVVGITLAGVALLFFVWQRRWKHVGVYCLVCVILYSPLKIHEWTSGATTFAQASILVLKNPYNATEGVETFTGFIERATNNIFNYLNYQFPSVLGIPMPANISAANGNLLPEASAFFGLLVSLIIVVGCITPIILRSISERSLLGACTLIYVGFLSFVLQNIFASTRYLVPIIPFIFLSTAEGVRILGNGWTKKNDLELVSQRSKKLILFSLSGIIFVSALSTFQNVEENYPVLNANLKGNRLAGFPEDWVNYLGASLWIKQNLPVHSTGVICRKPELFLLYAGDYNVYGTYIISQTHPDSIVAKWKSMNMTHLLYDDFQWSTTLRRYVQPVAVKYPQMFELVHTEGVRFPCYIFRLNYDAVIGPPAQSGSSK